jgi:hypothetical protein
MDQETSVRGGRALAEAVRRAYLDGQTDYTMEPLVQTLADGTPAGAIEPGDAAGAGNVK